MQFDLRNAIYERLQRLDFAGHDQLHTGQLVSRASTDLGLVQGLLAFLPIMLGNLVLLDRGPRGHGDPLPAAHPGGGGHAAAAAGRVAAAAGPGLPGHLGRPAAGRRGGRCGRRGRHRGAGGEGLRAGGPGARPPGRRRLRACTRRGPVWCGSRPSSPRPCRPSRRSPRWRCSALGGWLALEGHLTLGAFLAFSSYLVQLVAPVRMLAGLFTVGQQARAGAERILDVLDANAEVVDAPDAVELPATPGARCASRACGSATPRSEPVLDGLDLHVGAGRGGGPGGHQRLGQVDRHRPAAPLLRRGRGPGHRRRPRRPRRHPRVVAPPGRAWCSRTPSSSPTRCGPTSPTAGPTPTDAEIEAAAAAAGADGFVAALPEGYDTVVGERGVTPLGRSAPAPRPGPGHPHRPPHPRARRRHLGRRLGHRGGDPRHAARAHGRPHHDPHRPPPLDACAWPTASSCSTHGRVVAEGTHEELLVASSVYRDLFAGPEDVDARPVTTTSTARDSPRATGPARQARRAGRGRGRWPTARPRTIDRVGLARPRGRRRPGGLGLARRRPRHRRSRWWWHRGHGPHRHPEDAGRARRRCPPADDAPEVDVAAAAAAPSTGPFRVRRFVRPWLRWLGLGLGLVVLDTFLTLLGPALVRRGIDRASPPGDTAGAVDARSACSRWSAWSTGAWCGPTRSSPAAPPSGCSTPCG